VYIKRLTTEYIYKIKLTCRGAFRVKYNLINNLQNIQSDFKFYWIKMCLLLNVLNTYYYYYYYY